MLSNIITVNLSCRSFNSLEISSIVAGSFIRLQSKLSLLLISGVFSTRTMCIASTQLLRDTLDSRCFSASNYSLIRSFDYTTDAHSKFRADSLQLLSNIAFV